MKKIYQLFALIQIITVSTLLFSQTEKHSNQQQVILLPVNQIVDDIEYGYLEAHIYSTLATNIGKIPTILFLNHQEPYVEKITDFGYHNKNFEQVLKLLENTCGDTVCIFCEYYVSEDILYILINILDLMTGGSKYAFVEFLPADSSMLENIETMAAKIADAVARELPPSSRQVIFDRQVPLRLRLQIDKEEKLIENVFTQYNELLFTPLSAMAMARTMIAWSQRGPFIGPALGLEYTRFFGNNLHLRGGIELLLFDWINFSNSSKEISAELLFGWHSRSLDSISLDIGLAVIQDDNDNCLAISDTYGSTEFGTLPPASRISVSLPIQLGMTHYTSSTIFTNLRFKYHGLTLTRETLAPGTYAKGKELLKYENGFSVFNLLSFAVTLNIGRRF